MISGIVSFKNNTNLFFHFMISILWKKFRQIFCVMAESAVRKYVAELKVIILITNHFLRCASPSQNGKSSSSRVVSFRFESFSLISFGRLSQSQKAFLPIFDNDSGITTEVNILQPSKA